MLVGFFFWRNKMKTTPAVDIAATLIILASILLGGWWWLDHKTNQIEKALKTKPAVEVKKGLTTKAELTIFERAVKVTE
jgi:hypothetical protein